MLSCADCNAKLAIAYIRNWEYYICSHYRSATIYMENKCTRHSVSRRDIEAIVLAMLNELIEKIEVFQAEKPQNEHKQKLRIHFVCVGSIEILDVIPLPEPEIRIETRKGIAINYSCAQNAV